MPFQAYALLRVEGVLRPRLSDAVDLEPDGAESLAVHYAATIEDKGGLGHLVVNALVVEGLEFIPGGQQQECHDVRIMSERRRKYASTTKYATSFHDENLTQAVTRYDEEARK